MFYLVGVKGFSCLLDITKVTLMYGRGTNYSAIWCALILTYVHCQIGLT